MLNKITKQFTWFQSSWFIIFIFIFTFFNIVFFFYIKNSTHYLKIELDSIKNELEIEENNLSIQKSNFNTKYKLEKLQEIAKQHGLNLQPLSVKQLVDIENFIKE